jgi:hypothetical protein
MSSSYHTISPAQQWTALLPLSDQSPSTNGVACTVVPAASACPFIVATISRPLPLRQEKYIKNPQERRRTGHPAGDVAAPEDFPTKREGGETPSVAPRCKPSRSFSWKKQPAVRLTPLLCVCPSYRRIVPGAYRSPSEPSVSASLLVLRSGQPKHGHALRLIRYCKSEL